MFKFRIFKKKSFEMSIIRVTIFLSLMISFGINAQSGIIDKYQFNYLSFNPAFAGENGKFGIKALSENSFNLNNLGLNKFSQAIVLDGQLYGNAGLAFQGYRSSSTVLANTGLGLSYSKGYEINDMKLKAGLTGGVFIPSSQIVSVQTSTRVLPYAGLGVLGLYKGAFAGVSSPLLLSRNLPEPKFTYFNAGYFYDNIDAKVKFNANILYKYTPEFNEINYNLKIFIKSRIAIGSSLRQNLKKYELNPYINYKISNSTIVGLGYVKNPFGNYTVQSGTTSNPNSPFNSVFQIYLRFITQDEGDESWFGDMF